MPALRNTKHERFAQELAKGKTADEAYQLAGYAENRGNATRLKANESVAARVTELQERAATKVDLTIADIIEELEEARQEALSAATPQASAAVAASMGKAKLLGLQPDQNVNVSGSVAHTVEAAGLSEALGWIKDALGEGGQATD